MIIIELESTIFIYANIHYMKWNTIAIAIETLLWSVCVFFPYLNASARIYYYIFVCTDRFSSEKCEIYDFQKRKSSDAK